MSKAKFRIYSTVTGGFSYMTMEELLTSDNSMISKKGFKDDFSVTQFTGLFDKNGVDIYEGDIIKSVSELLRPFDNTVKTRTGEFVTKYKTVEFREGQSSFCFVGCPMTGISQKQATKYFEVAGNIHETPDLITQK